MVGKKARCSCGTAVLLQPAEIIPAQSGNQVPDLAIEDIPLPVPSVPSPTSESPTQRPKKAATSEPRKPRQRNRAQAGDRQRSGSTKPKSKSKRSGRPQPEPVETVQPTLVENSTDSRSRRESRRSSKRDGRRSSSSRSSRAATTSDQPVVADSFADMDAILNGGVDLQPIRPKPAEHPAPVAAPASPAQPAPAVSATPDQPTPSTSMASLASVVGGGAGILFGTIALAAKQLPLTETPIGWLSSPLHGMYQASFESGPVEGSYQTAFVALGWALVVFAVVSLIVGLAYLGRGLVALISGQFYLSWSRAAAATVGGASLFLVLGITLTQYAHHDHLQLKLDQVQGDVGPIGLVQDLDNVRLIRQQYVAEKQKFSLAMTALVTLPLTMFVAALLNLFCDPRPGASRELR